MSIRYRIDIIVVCFAQIEIQTSCINWFFLLPFSFALDFITRFICGPPGRVVATLVMANEGSENK